MEKLLLIDGNSLFNRAYYATPGSFSTKEGVPTNAVFGFTTMLFKAILDFQPTHMAVAFDVHEPTFRHKMFSDYKGTRKPMDPNLKVQVPLIKDMLDAMGIKRYEMGGLEADDLLGTISNNSPYQTFILTGDNDYLQLISKKTTIYLTKKGLSDLGEMNEMTIQEEKGLKPYQVIEYKALRGDTSDNIPGVAGVGEKTALDLLQKYDTLDGVYNNIEEIKGALKQKLIDNKEMAYLSRTLATIEVNANFPYSYDEMKLILPFKNQVREVFEKYEFKSLLKRTEFFEESTQTIKIVNNASNETIEDIESLKRIINDNMNKERIAIDFSSFSFSFDELVNYKIEVAKDLFGGIQINDVYNILKPILEGQITKVLYDRKQTKKDLDKFGIGLNNATIDLSLLQYIVDFQSTLSNLQSIIKYYDLPLESSASSMISISNEQLLKLKELNLEHLYFDIELPLSDVLYNMEKEGFKVDLDELKELEKSYTAEIKKLTESIHELAGETFNINSPKQLSEILYNKLDLGKGKKNKNGMSTAAEELEKIVDLHPIVPLVLRYRQINKLLSTYVIGLSEQIEQENKIHTVFNQALTVTGRLSSKEPNLQNIPVRSEEGRVLRKLFIPTKDYIVSADYSQIELRLLAHFSEDQVLIDAYNNGRDIHATTAASVAGVDISEVTSEMRSRAKAVNFGIIYGISDFGLSQQIHTTRKEAQNYISKYFEMYPTVKTYMDQNVLFAKENGYVSTITGRRRYIKEIHSANFVQRSFGERAAMNMPLQGSAADIIKIAMNKVAKRIDDEKLESRLILQIHDELIIDCKKDELETITRILKEEMENAVQLRVPLTVNISYGKSWYEAK